MKLILLPGMDGTGLLFQPFLDVFPKDISTHIIDYPCDKVLTYKELTYYVHKKLPINEEYILLAESFSGPIAYELSKIKHHNLKAIIFVASFIQPPNKFLIVAKLIPFYFLIPNNIPLFILKYLLGELANSHLISLVNQSLSKVNRKVLESRIKEMARLSQPSELIKVKCIYLQPNNDQLVSKINSTTIEKLAINFTNHKIEGSHFILQVNPKDCLDIIVELINYQKNLD